MDDGYRTYVGALRAALFDSFRIQLVGEHLNEQGLSGLRARLLHGGEFDPGPDLELLLREVNEAYAVMRGTDPHDMPGSEIPDDAAEIFETTAPDDASELDEPPES
jgi:hypothetical protein